MLRVRHTRRIHFRRQRTRQLPEHSQCHQLNTDGDAQGDACDSDDDNDGTADASDCAALDSTRWRSGTFYADPDGDGVRTNSTASTLCYGSATPGGYTSAANGPDNCPEVANPDQADSDHNGIGDACDHPADTDGDGIPDASDNCPNTANANQLNTDGDAQGDACDSDDDNDGTADASDCASLDSTRWRSGTFYADADGDGVRTNSTASTLCYGSATPGGYTSAANGPDNCPNTANANQLNTDGDAQGDACDSDDDNDGTADASDCASLTAPDGAAALSTPIPTATACAPTAPLPRYATGPPHPADTLPPQTP